MIFFLLASLIFALVAVWIYLFKQTEISKLKKFLFSLGFFISILFYVLYCVANYFTGEGINDDVIYTLIFGIDGAGFSDYKELIIISSASIILNGIFSLWLFFKKSLQIEFKKKYYFKIASAVLLLSISLNPTTAGIWKLFFPGNPLAKVDKESDFYNVYASSQIKQIGQPKNLVFIYAEGLERTYLDDSIFPGLTPNLKELESKSISFTNVNQTQYAGFTIAGMVASQCGLPLVAPNVSNSSYEMGTFLKNTVCLGDLLNKSDYYLSYMGGANLNFSGKGRFYWTHKFNEISGSKELLPKISNKKYKSSWGLYDDSLFDLDYKRFIELSKTKNKFALFTLTLDTHHPNGNPSETCKNIIYNNGLNSILNSVACSDFLIGNFIKKIRDSEYSENTVIVLASDHLAQKNTASELLAKGNRKNLFLINLHKSAEAIQINKLASTLDTGSTILPFIGYNANIGLGRDIINRNESDEQIKNIQNSITKWKTDISQF